MIPDEVVEVRARDYVARYVAGLSPQKRAEMETRNADLFASACCDDYPCGCEVK
jgi:hypothetical protein